MQGGHSENAKGLCVGKERRQRIKLFVSQRIPLVLEIGKMEALKDW